MDKKEEALKVFNRGFNCSQAVLSVFSDELKFDKDLALKISTGFGGGIRKGEVCGAVSGAIMTLGLKYGHNVAEDTETKREAYLLTKEFIDRFEEKNGTIICKRLLGYDISNPIEYEIIKDKDVCKDICPKLIEEAIEILEFMLSQ